MRIHIVAVSAQPLPNLLPCFSPQLKPDLVIGLCSHKMTENGTERNLKVTLSKLGIKYKSVTIENAFDNEYIEEICTNLLEQNSNDEIYGNVTGGTKPMSFGLYMACFNKSKPIFYIDGNTVNFLYSGNTQRKNKTVLSNMPFELMLCAHGFKIENSKKNQIPQTLKDRINQWRKKIREDSNFFSTLNWVASQAKSKDGQSFTTKSLNLPPAMAKRLLHDFDDKTEIDFIPNKQQATFANEEFRFFCNGGWLEDYIFDALYQLKLDESLGISEVYRSAKLRPSDSGAKEKTDNEIDVLALINNRLWVFEAKTIKRDEKDKAWINSALYKLAAINKNLGGLTTKATVVSLSPLDSTDKKRAEVLGIKIIDNIMLENLYDNLADFIKRN